MDKLRITQGQQKQLTSGELVTVKFFANDSSFAGSSAKEGEVCEALNIDQDVLMEVMIIRRSDTELEDGKFSIAADLRFERFLPRTHL